MLKLLLLLVMGLLLGVPHNHSLQDYHIIEQIDSALEKVKMWIENLQWAVDCILTGSSRVMVSMEDIKQRAMNIWVLLGSCLDRVDHMWDLWQGLYNQLLNETVPEMRVWILNPTLDWLIAKNVTYLPYPTWLTPVYEVDVQAWLKPLFVVKLLFLWFCHQRYGHMFPRPHALRTKINLGLWLLLGNNSVIALVGHHLVMLPLSVSSMCSYLILWATVSVHLPEEPSDIRMVLLCLTMWILSSCLHTLRLLNDRIFSLYHRIVLLPDLSRAGQFCVLGCHIIRWLWTWLQLEISLAYKRVAMPKAISFCPDSDTSDLVTNKALVSVTHTEESVDESRTVIMHASISICLAFILAIRLALR